MGPSLVKITVKRYAQVTLSGLLLMAVDTSGTTPTVVVDTCPTLCQGMTLRYY